MFKIDVPEVSEEAIIKRYKKIRPIINIGGKYYNFREFNAAEISHTNFLWNVEQNITKEIPKGEIEVIKTKDFLCLHQFWNPVIFFPRIRDVLSQIDKERLSEADYFEITENLSSVFHRNPVKDSLVEIARQNGYHVSVVRLYKKVK